MNGDTLDMPLLGEQVEVSRNAKVVELFDAHHARLYRLARRLVPTADEARDLVQETFLRVVRSANAIPGDLGSSEAWLVRILTNLCRDQWRQRATRGRLDAHYKSDSVEQASRDPESALVAHNAVWQALRALPPRRRAAIVLYELEGRPIPEIATLLGVSAVTIRWHLSRGRRELASAIARREKQS